jgi:hypothetical protein
LTDLQNATDNVAGMIYSLNFSEAFDTTKTNLTGLFTTSLKAGGAANNIAPNYVDGAMLSNNDEFYLYGFGFPPS